MGDPALLASKLREETEELIQALQTDDAGTDPPTAPANEVVHEAADLLYFTLVAAASRGASVDALRQELARRSLRVRRRPMTVKSDEVKSDLAQSDQAKPDDGENR
jgi:phosphoribosyl-ATP pyrophosphohydrolase